LVEGSYSYRGKHYEERGCVVQLLAIPSVLVRRGR
jgi:hypothetical protein